MKNPGLPAVASLSLAIVGAPAAALVIGGECDPPGAICGAQTPIIRSTKSER